MSNEELEKISKNMNGAINQNEEELLNVIQVFMGKIVAKSFYNGVFNEDIKLEIINNLYKYIPRFKGIKKD